MILYAEKKTETLKRESTVWKFGVKIIATFVWDDLLAYECNFPTATARY